MKIVALNIRQGGARRVRGLATYLCSNCADVIVASEFVPGAHGDALMEGLRQGGFSSIHSPGLPPDGYGLMLATKARSRHVRLRPAPIDSGRIVAAEANGIILFGVYFSLGKAKASLFDYLLSRPPALGDDTIVIGDMNTGLHRLDEPGATFDCADRFALLEKRGYVDLWRRQHGPQLRGDSWISPRGNPYRIDHAFGTGSVVNRTTSCLYDHDPRGSLTDHSALIVDMAD